MASGVEDMLTRGIRDPASRRLWPPGIAAAIQSLEASAALAATAEIQGSSGRQSIEVAVAQAIAARQQTDSASTLYPLLPLSVLLVPSYSLSPPF